MQFLITGFTNFLFSSLFSQVLIPKFNFLFLISNNNFMLNFPDIKLGESVEEADLWREPANFI